jgi:hypothetical protein
MADNTQLNSGSGGDVIASDDIGPGVKYQRVKVTLGADGVNDGDVASGNPMPTNPSDRAARDCGKIDIANFDTLPTFDLDSGAGTVNVQGIALAVAASGGPVAIPGDATNGLKVQVATMPTTTVQDGGGSISVDDNGGSLTVDGTVSISGSVAVTNADMTTLAGAVRAEDAASADGHTGIPALAVRKASPANTSGTDGDYEMIQMSAGRVWVSATVDAALPTGSNAIGKLAANSGVDIGDVDVTSLPALPAGTNDIGFVKDKAATSGGWTPHKKISAASTNATSLKASAGQVGVIVCTNTNASARFLKLYNKASAPTVGTDTPDLTFLIPGNTSGFTINCGCGFEFTTGIAYALTTGVADNNSGAVAADEILINLGYK